MDVGAGDPLGVPRRRDPELEFPRAAQSRSERRDGHRVVRIRHDDRGVERERDDDAFAPQHDAWTSRVANHPVGFLSWREALAYCAWLTEKLLASSKTPEPLRRACGTADDVPVPGGAVLANALDRGATLVFGSALPVGLYRATLASSVEAARTTCRKASPTC